MKPRKPIPRGQPPARRSPVRKRNPKRHKAEWLRAYGSEERVAWIASQPCVVPRCQWRFSEGSQNAHIVTGGTGRKADANQIVPACAWHHAQMHEGILSFQCRYSLDLRVEAAVTDRLWLAHLAQNAPDCPPG